MTIKSSIDDGTVEECAKARNTCEDATCMDVSRGMVDRKTVRAGQGGKRNTM